MVIPRWLSLKEAAYFLDISKDDLEIRCLTGQVYSRAFRGEIFLPDIIQSPSVAVSLKECTDSDKVDKLIDACKSNKISTKNYVEIIKESYL